MKTRNLLNKLAKKFPKRIAAKYHDHVGYMTGDMPNEVHKILLCLDLDDEIFDKVASYKPDLVITHHPFIFGSKYRVFKYDFLKKDLCERLDKIGIPVYSFHTNFDEGKDGMNDALAEALELKGIYAPISAPMMRIGELNKELEINEFARYAKEKLKIDYALLVNAGNKTIKKIGIIGGGGSRNWKDAQNEGCDIYISGDAPHYVRRDIINNHFNYLDVPHEVEHIFMPQMKKILLEIDPTLEIETIDHEKMPKVIL